MINKYVILNLMKIIKNYSIFTLIYNIIINYIAFIIFDIFINHLFNIELLLTTKSHS